MKKFFYSFLASSLFLFFCQRPRIFTDVSVEIKNLEELFPAEFLGERVELIHNKEERRFSSKEHLLGLYGSKLSLEAWDFEEKEKAKELFENLVQEKRKEKLKNYSSEKTGESRFDYETEENFAGLIFTNSGFLFAIEANSYSTLVKFINESKIGRIE